MLSTTRFALSSCLAVLAAGLPSVAAAQGPYVELDIGLARFPALERVNRVTVGPYNSVCRPGKPLCEEVPETFDQRGTTADGSAKGWAAAGAFGYAFDRVRIEAEFAHRRVALSNQAYDPDEIAYLNDVLRRPASPTSPYQPGLPALTAGDLPSSPGAVSVRSAMANALLTVAETDRASLYFGVGAGLAWASSVGVRDTIGAQQFLGGVRIRLSPSLSAGLKYRYMRTGRADLDGATTAIPGNQFVVYYGGIESSATNNATITPHVGGRLNNHLLGASIGFEFAR